jgi:hypothetical protein
MTNVVWVEPALTWSSQAKLSGLRTPRILEIRSDDFMEEFLQAMRGVSPHTYIQNHLMTPKSGKIKLFQPLHGCYYLVTASLVCRQVGLPDRTVKGSQGETTGFVIRRWVGNEEQGWVNEGDTRGWNTVDPKKGLVDEEEILPMNPVSVCTEKTPGLAAYQISGSCERVVYHGYLPVGNRDKYTATKKYIPAANQTNEQLFSTYLTEVRTDDVGNLEDANGGFRASEFDTRVIAAWTAYTTPPPPSNPPIITPPLSDVRRRTQAAYYIVVDMADFVRRALPDVWAALTNLYDGKPNPDQGLQANQQVLYDLLTTGAAAAVVNGNALGRAMYDVKGIVEADSPFLLPVASSIPDTYALGALPKDPASPPDPNQDLKQAVINALSETPATQMKINNEYAELLREQVRVPKPETSVRYALRLIYTYDPECPPLVSEPSPNIEFSRFFDSDAPSRKVRIEAPQLKDLRKFKPGVGIQMDKDLRDVLNRVHKGLKDGEDLGGQSVDWELGMICSFSIQIVFLVALIVMFIFLILLNIVFWWLPFLKICLPIPKPK